MYVSRVPVISHNISVAKYLTGVKMRMIMYDFIHVRLRHDCFTGPKYNRLVLHKYSHIHMYTKHNKKVSTFVITTISHSELKCSIQLEYIIHHFCQLRIKLKFPKLLKLENSDEKNFFF